MTNNKKTNAGLTIARLEAIKNHHSQRIHQIESCLDAKLFPTITAEWGDDLVELIEQDIIPLASLRVFLEYAPFSINYWNNIKGIYKLLETKLVKLSQLKRQTYKHKYEISLIIDNLAVIFSRLEKQRDCSKCPGFYSQKRKRPIFCKNPCEQWPGGIKYTRNNLDHTPKPYDKLEIIARLKKVKGIHAAEIFIETRNSIQKVSLLLLVDKIINGVELRRFIQLSQKFDQSLGIDSSFSADKNFPKIDKIRVFDVSMHKHPWVSRGASETGPRSYFHSHIRNELYADIRSFTDNAKPSEKTLQYMRRRCRRLLRTLQKNNADLYVDLCLSFFTHLNYPQKDKMSSQWLLNEIIFGADKSLSQKKHGRGDIRYPQDYDQNIKRLEPCKLAWDKAIKKIKPVITKGDSYLVITEFLIKIWNDQNIKKRQVWLGLSAECLDNYLQSSSNIIACFALEQLELKPQKINKIQPSSIARGLASIKTEDAEYYFRSFFQTNKKLLDPTWFVRFSFDFDDAIHSIRVNAQSDEQNQHALILGLLSLQLPWNGYINFNLSKQLTTNKRLPKQLFKQIKSPFQWSSNLKPSTWLNGKWRKPNLSQLENGLIGWPHAIFDRDIQTVESQPEINLDKYLLDANPRRLLNLLNMEVHLLRCYGSDVPLSKIEAELRPKEIIREIKEFKKVHGEKANLNSILDDIVNHSEGHFTDSDLRVEPCKVCGSGARNHAAFIPYIHQEKEQHRTILRESNRGPHVSNLDGKKASSFWTKVHEHKQNFKTLIAPNWLETRVILSLNKMLNNKELKPTVIKEINNITGKAIDKGNDDILINLLENYNSSVPLKNIVKGLISIDQDKWVKQYKNGNLLPESLFESNEWMALIWKKLGDQSAEIRGLINSRFFTNRDLESLIVKNFIPDFIENLSDEQASFLSFFIDARPELFDMDTPLLMKACLSSHSIINEKALEFAKQLGLTISFSIRLIESNFPTAVDIAKEYFNSLDTTSSDYVNDILALCDSPHEQTRLFGLELIEKNRERIPLAQILLQLKENRHNNIRRFLANELAQQPTITPDSMDFDIGILRSRNNERTTKELIKNRLENQLTNVNQIISKDLIKSLRELSLGLIPRDKEWAIKQLTKLRLRGIKIPELEIEKIEEIKNEISPIL